MNNLTSGQILTATLFILSASLGLAQNPGDVDTTFNKNNLGDRSNHGVEVSGGTSLLRGGLYNKFWICGVSEYDDVSIPASCRFLINGDRDTTFNLSANAGGDKMVEYPDSTVLFQSDYRVSRVFADGTIDASYISEVDGGTIRDMAVLANNKVLLVGNFNEYNGQSIHRIVRIHSNGTVDSSYNPAPTGISHSAVRVRPDSNIVLVGWGAFDKECVVLNSDGTHNTQLTPDPADLTLHGRLAPWTPDNEKTLFIDCGTEYEGQTVSGIFLVDSLMNLDPAVSPTFGDSVYQYVRSPIEDWFIYPDGRMIFVGNKTFGSDPELPAMIRVFPDGSPDPTFQPSDLFVGPDPVNISNVHVDLNGDIYISGHFDAHDDATYRNGIMRLDSTGAFDHTFMAGNGFNDVVYEVVQLPDGRYIAGGEFTTFRGRPSRGIACITQAGELDTTFQIGSGIVTVGMKGVCSLVVDAEGGIIVGGEFEEYNGIDRISLLRLNDDGTLDTNFHPFSDPATFAGRPDIYDIAIQANGQILVGGDIHWIDPHPDDLGRFNSDGTPAHFTGVGSGFSNKVLGLAVQPDGRIVCGGQFSTYSGQNVQDNFCRLMPNGAVDWSFDLGVYAVGDVRRVDIQPDGKILFAGGFTTNSGIARVHDSGNRDFTFEAGEGVLGRGIHLIQDGRVLVACSEIDQVPQQGLARLNANGSTDVSFGQADPEWDVWPHGYDQVNSIIMNDAGMIIAAGDFRQMRGHGANGIVRLYNDVTTDIIESSSFISDKKILAGPNPTTGITYVRLPESKVFADVEIDVYDGIGQLVYRSTERQADSTLQLDLSGLSAGPYLMQVIGPWGVSSERIIIQ